MSAAHRTVTKRLNDLANDAALAMGRFDEALELLAVWASEHPGDGLSRASLNLILRCGLTVGDGGRLREREAPGV